MFRLHRKLVGPRRGERVSGYVEAYGSLRMAHRFQFIHLRRLAHGRRCRFAPLSVSSMPSCPDEGRRVNAGFYSGEIAP